eukprot:4625344-Amphidinium_carterae.1
MRVSGQQASKLSNCITGRLFFLRIYRVNVYCARFGSYGVIVLWAVGGIYFSDIDCVGVRHFAYKAAQKPNTSVGSPTWARDGAAASTQAKLQQTLQKMTDYNVPPSAVTYGTVVKALL